MVTREVGLNLVFLVVVVLLLSLLFQPPYVDFLTDLGVISPIRYLISNTISTSQPVVWVVIDCIFSFAIKFKGTEPPLSWV